MITDLFKEWRKAVQLLMLHGLSNDSFSSAFNTESNDPSARRGHWRRGKSVAWIGRMPWGLPSVAACMYL